MLVLSRLKDEKIIIYLKDCTSNQPTSILATITIIEIKGNKVRLGFEAPKDVIIHREEVFNQIMKELKEQQT